MKQSTQNKIQILVALSAGAITAYGAVHHTGHLDSDDLRFIFATLATISVTLLGFVLAALSILSALSDRETVARLQKAGHWATIVRQLKVLSFLLIVILALGAAGLIVSGAVQDLAFKIASALTAITLVALLWAGYFLIVLLEEPMK